MALRATKPLRVLALAGNDPSRKRRGRRWRAAFVLGQPSRRDRCGLDKKGKTSGEDYISLSLADPAFGPKKLYANLGRAAGQGDGNVYAVIWNPAE